MKSAVLLIALLALSACAGGETRTAATGGRICFLTDDVDNWLKESDTSVLLKTQRRDYYRSRIVAPCNDLDFANRVSFESRSGPWICEGDSAVIRPRQVGLSAERCDLIGFHRLTPEEVASLGTSRLP